MNKKVASLIGAGALLVGFAVPVFAHGMPMPMPRSEDELTVENRDTKVDTEVMTVANTGLNQTSGTQQQMPKFNYFGGYHWYGDKDQGGDIRTGDAAALGTVYLGVNYTNVAGCGCYDDVKVENKDTRVYTDVWTFANTGMNRTRGGGDIRTGDAYADSYVDAMVNTTVVGTTAD